MDILICDPASEKVRQYLKNQGISFTYAPAIPASELLKIVNGYRAVMVRSRTKITAEVISRGGNLKVIARIGSGYDNIDIDSARKKKITVVNAPDANSLAVAEMTIGLMLVLLRGIYRAVRSMAEGKWLKDELWGTELSAKKVGVLGYGHVGRKVVDLLKAFGAEVAVYSWNYQTTTLEELFRQSDIITLHLSLNDKTKSMVGEELLGLMKKEAYFINMSRGQIVDEEALFKLLSEKKIAGAALDVFWQEPLPPDSKWRSLPNLIATPHIGAATDEALEKASLTVAYDIVRVLKGQKPDNQV